MPTLYVYPFAYSPKQLAEMRRPLFDTETSHASDSAESPAILTPMLHATPTRRQVARVFYQGQVFRVVKVGDRPVIERLAGLDALHGERWDRLGNPTEDAQALEALAWYLVQQSEAQNAAAPAEPSAHHAV